MTPAEATRPVLIALVCAGSLAVSGCGAVDSDPHRFSALAEKVSAIDIPLSADHAETRHAVAERAGLRPARFTPVKVAVMDPHAMWDARDLQAGLRPVADPSGLRDAVVRAASPLVVKAAAEEAVSQVQPPLLRPAHLTAPASGRTIQLGAYSTAAGARQAWDRVKTTSELSGLSPIYQEVEVGGRRLTRLKVGPVSTEAAAAVCRSAAVADAWCARNS